MAEYGGWTGKTLRVDLTTEKITTEDTIKKYKDFLGGTGLAYKVMWDEVPAGTKAWDPENRIIFGVGPLTGTSAPTSARVNITTLMPSHKDELPGHGHMGGHWGAVLKYAGFDSVIVQGKAEKPVWIYINDGKAEIRDAQRLWGNGIFRATAEICAEVGEDAHVAAIGQAGENLCRLSTVQCDRSHSAGGPGSVMGSKNLKAIAVKGSGSVKIAAKPDEWKKLVEDTVYLMGANNQHVVPSTPQPWAEYSGRTRWTAAPGLYWGAADPPLDTGICSAEDMNRMGLRTHKGYFDHGAAGETHTVRMDGCHSCPIRCHVMTDVPDLEQYGVSRYQGNTCIGNSNGKMIYAAGPARGSELALTISQLGTALFDDYGLWGGYIAALRVCGYLYTSGFWEEKLDEKEFESIPWDLMEAQDPAWVVDYVDRVVYKKGLFGEALAEGPSWMMTRWPELEEIWDEEYALKFWKAGHSYHHSTENGGQVGALQQLIFNRDPNQHTHTNFLANGLPLEVLKELGKDLFGTADAVEAYNDHAPMNKGKAVFSALALITLEIHNSLTMCNWVMPLWASPHKDRKYAGDPDMEAKVYSAVTGDEITTEGIREIGLRNLSLFRALNTRAMGEIDQRNKHDTIPTWAFEHGDEEPFTTGTNKMDREDMELAKDLFYEELGWDVKTGVPTRETLEGLGLKDVADELEAAKLLPA